MSEDWQKRAITAEHHVQLLVQHINLMNDCMYASERFIRLICPPEGQEIDQGALEKAAQDVNTAALQVNAATDALVASGLFATEPQGAVQ